MNRIKCSIMSMTGKPHPDEQAEYLRWHLLDHMPEQYQLPGMLLATRWLMDDECANATLHSSPPFDGLRSVMQYLVGDPVQQTLDDFLELGQRLRELGRFPVRMPSLQLSAYALLRADAAPRVLVSGGVVPFRPHRGILLIVEEATPGPALDEWSNWVHVEHTAELLSVEGCAGACVFGTTSTWSTPGRFDVGHQLVTVVYCDEDVVEVASAADDVVRERWRTGVVRPVVASPLRSMVRWEAWT
jgi:hypothetical protein